MDYQLINKYLSGNASEEEVEIIFEWLEDASDNKKLFIAYKKAWALSSKDDGDHAIVWQQILSTIRRNRRKTRRISVLKYAAIFVGFLGITYFLSKNDGASTINEIKIPDEAITLQLDNGNIEVITTTGERKIVDAQGKVVGVQKGAKLNYNSKNRSSTASGNQINTREKLVYNELTIPYGKIFQIVLSDGTQVYLNAGSSLKYPVKFLPGLERQIFLKGEAYFNVSKDADHPFIVNANDLNVGVLGTKFNVSSYLEDKSINTVLVEGSVGLYNKGEAFNSQKTLLKPGHKAEWDKKMKAISIKPVDTDIYTGWIQGKIIFKNIPFKNIRKKLERHYNVTIINNNKTLEENTYNAVFDIETIEQVLETLNTLYPINYTIENNIIIIN